MPARRQAAARVISADSVDVCFMLFLQFNSVWELLRNAEARHP
jgi:hypothetical protein